MSATLTFDQAVKEITTYVNNGCSITLMKGGSVIEESLPIWKADVTLVENNGLLMVEKNGVRQATFENNGQYGVTWKV